MAFDAIHDLAIANRKKLLDRAATDKTKLLGFHWPYPGVGHAERKDSAYQYDFAEFGLARSGPLGSQR